MLQNASDDSDKDLRIIQTSPADPLPEHNPGLHGCFFGWFGENGQQDSFSPSVGLHSPPGLATPDLL